MEHRNSKDGSMWYEKIVWHDATPEQGSGPVEGHVVLLYLPNGFEIMSLDGDRLSGNWQNQVVVCDFRGVSWKNMREEMTRLGARWWAYLPNGPPLSVAEKLAEVLMHDKDEEVLAVQQALSVMRRSDKAFRDVVRAMRTLQEAYFDSAVSVNIKDVEDAERLVDELLKGD